MNTLYGDSIFESYNNIDVLYSEIFESYKIFEDFDTINESLVDTFVSIIETLIRKIKEFLNWIFSKVKPYWKKCMAKLKIYNLKRKIKILEAKYNKINEATEDRDYYNYINTTDIECYSVDNINAIMNFLDNTKDKIELFESSVGSKYIKDTSNKQICYLRKTTCTIKEFIDNDLEYIIKDLSILYSKLISKCEKLKIKQRALENELKSQNNILKLNKDEDDMKDITKEYYNKFLTEKNEVDILIYNYTTILKDVTMALNTLIPNYDSIDSKLDEFIGY